MDPIECYACGGPMPMSEVFGDLTRFYCGNCGIGTTLDKAAADLRIAERKEKLLKGGGA